VPSVAAAVFSRLLTVAVKSLAGSVVVMVPVEAVRVCSLLVDVDELTVQPPLL
jgi:hypothetical protein